MRKPKLTSLRQDQGGMILVEIVVSAAMLITVALGVFLAFDAGTRATAEERHRARAHSLAQADVERMRGMRIADLSALNQTRSVNQDGLNYTIRSLAEFVNEPATTSTCASGTGSRDLLKVSSTVTWPSIGTRPPVRVSSVVSPPNGSIIPNTGSLLASVKDSRSVGMSGVTMTGSGAGSFNGTTGAGGCVIWRNLPAGNYTLTLGGAVSGKVDTEGVAPTPQTASVVAGSTNTVNYQYDSPGRIQNVTFRTRDYNNNLDTTTADSIVVDQTGMNTARVFAASPAGRALSITTPTTLYPFTSPYSVYAGTCGDNNPTGGGALGSSTVPVGGTVTGPQLQLPSLLVNVWRNGGNRAEDARVTVTDNDCGVTRVLTDSTDSNGRIPDVAGRPVTGLPYGTNYEVCANNSAGTDERKISNFALTNVGTTGTTLDIFLNGAPSGTCP